MRGLARLSLAGLLAAACATPTTSPIASRPATPPTAMGPAADEPGVLVRAAAEEQAIAAAVDMHDDPLVSEYLAGVADRLLLPEERASGARELTIAVVRDPTINAFVLPTGRIYVHTGLLSRLENEAQLAAVLARALALLSRADAVPRAAGAAEIDAVIARIAPSIGAALPAATAAMGEDAGAARLSPMAGVILGKRLGLSYVAAMTGSGREAETQADAGAVRRLAEAAYDVTEAPRAFERLRREARAGGALETFFLGGDAALAERIDVLQRLAGGTSAVAATAADGGDYQVRAAAVVRENASLEMRAGRFKAAQEQLDRVLAVAPGDALAHLYSGDLYRLRSQRARSVADRDELARAAVTSYERCASLDPSLGVVFRQIGLLYYQQRQVGRAREAFARYVEQDPDAPDAARVREYLAPPRVP
jgi:predicted Zn-dependent protease